MLCERDASDARILSDAGFLFELKLDGARVIADKDGDRVTLSYRRARDATASYPEIADAVRALAEPRVVLDGEIVAFDEQGRPDFQRLGTRIQSGGSRVRRALASVPVVYVVFDVLAIGDRDLTALPIESRKELLEAVLPADARDAGGLIRGLPTFDEGTALFQLCRERGLEGVVAKRRGSRYVEGTRSRDWVKVKHELDVDLVVVGWTEGEGGRARLGALDLAAYEPGEPPADGAKAAQTAPGKLVFHGSVGSGLDEATIDVLAERLRELEVAAPPVEVGAGRGKAPAKKGRHWTRPEIVVNVRFAALTAEGILRHPVFRGVRADVRPEDCVWPPVVAPPRPARSPG